MGHLACVQHGRRVLVLGNAILHRNGDGSPCYSSTLKSHDALYPREEIPDLMLKIDLANNFLKTLYTDPKE